MTDGPGLAVPLHGARPLTQPGHTDLRPRAAGALTAGHCRQCPNTSLTGISSIADKLHGALNILRAGHTGVLLLVSLNLLIEPTWENADSQVTQQIWIAL